MKFITPFHIQFCYLIAPHYVISQHFYVPLKYFLSFSSFIPDLLLFVFVKRLSELRFLIFYFNFGIVIVVNVINETTFHCFQFL